MYVYTTGLEQGVNLYP